MLRGGLVCGRNTGMSHAISPVKQPEHKAIVTPRCVSLPFDSEHNEKERKTDFSLQHVLGFISWCQVRVCKKCNSQWCGICEVKVVRLEPSCRWLLDALSFPLSVSREWRPSAQSQSSCSCPLLAPTGKDHFPGRWPALSWGSASCA